MTLGLALLLALGSAYLILTSAELPCERRPPLTILATLSAFLIALSFRQLASSVSSTQTRILIVCLLLAGGAMFSDVRFVMKYRTICSGLQEQLRQLNQPVR